ncbi:hypothetical protein H5V45_14370 [Nocardioides sp. KIGAM211]|uniref:PqqD family protein n=1 Tax=Nocardioides luti TaxID=2761101 RepID=A0A7X0RHQ7_9ACTN|nr:hypothetical protein [Nocardioides luti]MBB6628506.1 hypothetical protein [Nocardioides luti]
MRLVLGDLKDQYTDGDGVTVVMVGQRVLLLSPLASEILRCLSGTPVELESVATHVRAVLGEPPTNVAAEVLLQAVARDLAGSGIIRIVSPT